jgi:hypothetical protein
VFLNGEAVGVTPLVLRNVRIGSQAVRVELPGYERWSTAVRVVANQRTTTAAQLQRSRVQ